MMKIKCPKCGKVYKFEEKICPKCGYNIEEDENLSLRSNTAIVNKKGEKIARDKRAEKDAEALKEKRAEMDVEDLEDKEDKEDKIGEVDKNKDFSIEEDAGGTPRLQISLRVELVVTVVIILVVLGLCLK